MIGTEEMQMLEMIVSMWSVSLQDPEGFANTNPPIILNDIIGHLNQLDQGKKIGLLQWNSLKHQTASGDLSGLSLLTEIEKQLIGDDDINFIISLTKSS